MSCRTTDLQDFAYGFLDEANERRVREHLAGCARCRAEFERLDSEKNLLTRAASSAVPVAARSRSGWVAAVPVGLAAALLLSLLGILITREPDQKPDPEVSNSSPAAQQKEVQKTKQEQDDPDTKKKAPKPAIKKSPPPSVKKTPKPVIKKKPAPAPKKGDPNQDRRSKIQRDLDFFVELLQLSKDPKVQAKLQEKIAKLNQELKLLSPKGLKTPTVKKGDPDSDRRAGVKRKLNEIYKKMKMAKDPTVRAKLEDQAAQLGQELKLLSQGTRSKVNIKRVELRLRENPDDVNALLERATWYIDNGKGAAAMPDLDRAIRLKPDLAPAYLKRAVAYAFTGQMEGAQKNLMRGEDLDPNDRKGIAYARGLIKKLSGAGRPQARSAKEIKFQIRALEDRLEELRAMAADADFPVADRKRAGDEGARVQAEIDRLNADLKNAPLDPGGKRKK